MTRRHHNQEDTLSLTQEFTESCFGVGPATPKPS